MTSELEHLEAALRRLDMVKDAEGWSGTTGREELFGLRRRANGSIVHRSLGLTSYMWNIHPSRPSTVELYFWAQRMAERGYPVPADCVGWAWSMEGWMVQASADMPEHEKDQIKAASRNREYYKYPSREEVRAVYGCLFGGTELSVIHVRGGEVAAERNMSTSGYVPAALRLLCGLEARLEGEVSVDDL